jgi:uncharacterized protein (TIGR02679 family)
LAPLWTALHARLSAGRPVAQVRLGPLDVDQRTALADLLGLSRLPSITPHISTARVDDLVTELVGQPLSAVVAEICGPIGNEAARRAERTAARVQLWSWFANHEVVRAQPALAAWVSEVRRGGVVGQSIGRTRSILEQALAVLAALPADGRPLASVAEHCTGDPHALDGNSRLAQLVLRALAAIHDEPVATDAEGRRAAWERAGIACDALSTVVLAAGLHPSGDDPLAVSLRAWAQAGQAMSVTLAQVRSVDSLRISDPDVWVVENPTILALALQRFGASCPPLICTAGWPNGAGMLLLRLLSVNACLHYHGDFDPDGIRIASHILAATGARPWRMSADDYRAAAAPAAFHPPVNASRLTEASWDVELSEAMAVLTVTVPEEHVAASLLADLSDQVR